MHWSTRLKVVAAAAMLAAAIWLAGMPHDAAPERATLVANGVTKGAAKEAAAPATPRVSGPVPCAGLKGLIIPVRGVRKEQLSDTFSDARSENRRHDALDIMAPRGTPVIAAAAGRVEKLFLSDAGGTTAYLRSPDGRLVYYYAHLDRYAAGLSEGQQLAQGAPIGTVGTTGNANPDGPHLHFAIMATAPEQPWWEDAGALNPYPLLAGRGTVETASGCR